MKRSYLSIFNLTFVLVFYLILGCYNDSDGVNENATPDIKRIVGKNIERKRKVMYVDSYHAEYVPSTIMQKAVRNILEPVGIEVSVVYLDAKRNKSDEMLRHAALKAKDAIESYKPELVIAADDAASKYLIMPYYKDAELPFVFIGVNWDASSYGYPYRNVTGQIEVELVKELLNELRKYAQGNRIGILSGETLTDLKANKHYQDILQIHFNKREFVNDFKAWKEAYLSLQDEVDILLVRNNSGIEGWHDEKAESFVFKHTKIPTGTVSTHLSRWVLISYSKVNHEFGEYAANTALKILDGKSPADIPISTNKQAKVYLNMRLAKKLSIKFSMELIERATFVEEGGF